jgi:Amino acid permease
MTFTAARVKQEIAKEGILPGSLFLATGRITALSWLRSRLRKSQAQPASEISGNEILNLQEQVPTAALGLQWLSSIFLLAVTAGFSVTTQFTFLTSLYSYVMVMLIAFCTTSGLLYCKFVRRDWKGEYRPWGGPTAAIIFW